MKSPEPKQEAAAPSVIPQKKENFYQTMSAQEFRSHTAAFGAGKPLTGFSVKQPAALSPAELGGSLYNLPDAVQPAGSLPGSHACTDHHCAKAGAERAAQPMAKPPVQSPVPAHAQEQVRMAEAKPLIEDAPAKESAEVPTEPPVQAPMQIVLPSSDALPVQETIETEKETPWRIAGEVLRTYIIAEDEKGNVYLIDKHAAHERVNFDRMKQNTAPIMG